MAPAAQEYAAAAAGLYGEFTELFAKHAINELGCDESCVQSCLNPEYIGITEVPDCLRWCQCDQRVLKLSEGRYSYPALMLFSKYNLQAW